MQQNNKQIETNTFRDIWIVAITHFVQLASKNGQILKTRALFVNRSLNKLNKNGKDHKISKQKCKENKQNILIITRIFVKDKTQSQKEEHFNVLLELLIEFILADSIYNIYLIVND
ncbi:unnamed protein product (macronuclear) [Paramecium tetraurelia]|uniref:Uncharacterized protein n=1 Tax=Paramecium tetraurelia TaxID=5888 RepID=A0BS20_PARTE|nr:uncharacterized protein GSPATT00031568001 [Paramecium tetraurelia]CAK61337.1 unnamed protein product [Paramecium tetraurelia]|eukprot:XP_001428735.1 hypothetical protein (macronuclear) [Paramecium tetraurelia strain d4-2]